MDYHTRTRHKFLSEVWKVVENKGSLGALDHENDELNQIPINELNFIKHSLHAPLIEIPVKEMTFDSNLIVDTCMYNSNTYKQLTIVRDYLEHSATAAKWKVLAQKFTNPKLNLVEIYEPLFSSI